MNALAKDDETVLAALAVSMNVLGFNLADIQRELRLVENDSYGADSLKAVEAVLKRGMEVSDQLVASLDQLDLDIQSTKKQFL